MISGIDVWIKSSIIKNFQSLTDLYIEHDLRNADEPVDRYELRVDGPFLRELHKDYFHIMVEVSVLVQTRKAEADLYKHSRRKNTALLLFNKCISVTDPSDNNEQKFILYRQDDFRNPTAVNDFGTIEPELDIIQATIETKYYSHYLKEN